VAEHPTRKLAVILHADVVGSTALVQHDEARAHERIQDVFHRFAGTIGSYNGHPLELRGDALVAEFNRASDAVEASLAFQAENTRFNANLEDDIQPTLRIGISLGEVVVADNTVTGEGIVLAQRLEQLASGGGVCIQGAVHEAVPGRLPFDYESLGEQEVKGFSEPVRAYAVSLKAGEAMPAPEVHALPAGAQPERPKKRWIVLSVVAVLIIVGGGLAWFQPWVAREEPASIERMAFPLPDKPSIAVLPFTNMSGDPEQEYFVDGITEDLTTDLSKISGLFVIARNSAFTYKGKAVTPEKVARELSVRYVVEGSVRRAGGQVRINAQLIDTSTGGHLWAERYDGQLTDIFGLQDRVTRSIVSAMAVELTPQEQQDLARRETESLQAYDYVLRGRQQLARLSREGVAKARELFEKAVDLDPGYARAHTNLGLLYYNEWRLWGRNRNENLARAVEYGRKAVAQDDRSAGTHTLLAVVHHYLGEQNEAEIEAQRALALDPTHPETLGNLGDFLRRSGRPAEAIKLLNKAIRLEPYYPPDYLAWLGHCYFDLGEYEEAIRVLNEGVAQEPDYLPFHLFLAQSYAMLDRQDEAKAQVAEILRLNPAFTVSEYEAYMSLSIKKSAYLEPDLIAQRKAGLPE
jgi:TolB-like protein/class 3 adenylate cyclase/Flp pilus assembly protein TadD